MCIYWVLVNNKGGKNYLQILLYGTGVFSDSTNMIEEIKVRKTNSPCDIIVVDNPGSLLTHVQVKGGIMMNELNLWELRWEQGKSLVSQMKQSNKLQKRKK